MERFVEGLFARLVHDLQDALGLLQVDLLVLREEGDQLGQRPVEVGGDDRRHDAPGILLARHQRVVAVALALRRVAHEAFVLEDFEEGRHGGVGGARLGRLADDLAHGGRLQAPEDLHDLLLAARQLKLFFTHCNVCFLSLRSRSICKYTTILVDCKFYSNFFVIFVGGGLLFAEEFPLPAGAVAPLARAG